MRFLCLLALFLVACPAPGDDSRPDDDDATGDDDDATGDDDDATGDDDDDDATGDDDDDDSLGLVVPLFGADTEREPDWIEEREDAIVTRFADRGRDRHAREDEFQSYDHYLPQYWEYRTVRMMFTDRVARGGDSIDVSMVSEWRLSIAEFRAWYLGLGTVATYSGNYAPGFEEAGPGTFDRDHELVSGEGDQYRYRFTLTGAFELGTPLPLAPGQFMEFEASQFLAGAPGARQNYYGTTALYAVGTGGLVPWEAAGDFSDPSSEREDSRPIDEAGWLGGRTTLPYQYSDEPDNHFMQMATNLGAHNGQAFVRGRRVHHTDMVDGTHDESDQNPAFGALAGLSGPHFIEASCDGCHKRNGRAPVAEVGAPLTAWVFRIGAEDGGPDPARGHVLQPAGVGEGEVVIGAWDEVDGLRTPRFEFEGEAPERFSGRLAPPLVGMGLLEAITEDDVLAWEDPDDADGDGISGRAARVVDPATGELRLGRFGWKAGTSSLLHQSAAALNTDMGVMTALLPEPDCGPAQTDCGPGGAELGDEHLSDLVKYVALLGVRARRALDDPEALRGEELFAEIGCGDCHRSSFTTSPHAALAEVRGQVIAPYTDLLLHDMGPGLADSLGEGGASGAEWRTPPLWGIGLGPCVTGGVTGPHQSQVCTPHESYLHDGRARTLEEAIRWHGGEGAASRDAFMGLGSGEREAVLAFLRSL